MLHRSLPPFLLPAPSISPSTRTPFLNPLKNPKTPFLNPLENFLPQRLENPRTPFPSPLENPFLNLSLEFLSKTLKNSSASKGIFLSSPSWQKVEDITSLNILPRMIVVPNQQKSQLLLKLMMRLSFLNHQKHFLFEPKIIMLLLFPDSSISIGPHEHVNERKRGDTKEHPLTQWFMNFFEADELLKLAAARQQDVGIFLRGQHIWSVAMEVLLSKGMHKADQCFFPQNIVSSIKTPAFILNTSYDVWQKSQAKNIRQQILGMLKDMVAQQQKSLSKNLRIDKDDRSGSGKSEPISNEHATSINDGLYFYEQGLISVSMSLHQTTFCFICCHLTSGQKEGDELRRNSDVT